jgi:hypothetical protein
MARSTNPFGGFDSSPEVIRLLLMMYVRYPLSLRNVAAAAPRDRAFRMAAVWIRWLISRSPPR